MNIPEPSSSLPRLSIITVNLNNRDGLERTLASVQAQQDFTSFEHIVVDGDSTDGSQEVLRRHEGHLSRWISEPDNGIYHAMNKGAALARGEYLLFLNSGDCLAENNVLQTVFTDFPQADIVYGTIQVFRDGQPAGQTISPAPEHLNLTFWIQNTIQHSGSFIRRSLLIETPYAEDYSIVADRKFFFESFLAGKTFARIPHLISMFHMGGISSDPRHAALKRTEWDKLFTQHMSMTVLARLREEIVCRNRQDRAVLGSHGHMIHYSADLQETLRRWIDLFFWLYRFHPARFCLNIWAGLLRHLETRRLRRKTPATTDVNP